MSHGQNIEKYLVPENGYELYVHHGYFSQAVDSIATSNSNIYDVALYREDSHVTYHYRTSDSAVNGLLAYHEDTFKQPRETASFQVLASEDGLDSCIVYVLPVQYLSKENSYWKKQIGCLIIFSNMEQIMSTLNDSSYNIVKNIGIVNEENRLLAGSSSMEKSADLIKNNYRHEKIQGTNLSIAYEIDTNMIFKKFNFFEHSMLSILALFIFLYLILLYIYNSSIIRPISGLHDQIKSIMNNRLEKRIVIGKEDEIGSIGKAINSLLDYQHASSSQLLEVQKKFYESTLKVKENELRVLENQINSHFIINTLQCISGMAIACDAPVIAEVSTNMSKIFGYSLRSAEIMTLGDEIGIVKKYLSIIDNRFNYLFSWNISINEEYFDQLIPKLVLQSMVENAVSHGLESAGKGSLSITCSSVRDMLRIEVWDNGVGIPPQKLYELKNILSDEETLYQASLVQKRIGLANSCLRIKNYFGSDYGIDIDSSPEGGTAVSILLPRTGDPAVFNFPKNSGYPSG